jgi:hypothetical protein
VAVNFFSIRRDAFRLLCVTRVCDDQSFLALIYSFGACGTSAATTFHQIVSECAAAELTFVSSNAN